MGILLLGNVVARIIITVQTLDLQYFIAFIDLQIKDAIYHTIFEQPKYSFSVNTVCFYHVVTYLCGILIKGNKHRLLWRNCLFIIFVIIIQ